jgi:cytochrome c2
MLADTRDREALGPWLVEVVLGAAVPLLPTWLVLGAPLWRVEPRLIALASFLALAYLVAACAKKLGPTPVKRLFVGPSVFAALSVMVYAGMNLRAALPDSGAVTVAALGIGAVGLAAAEWAAGMGRTTLAIVVASGIGTGLIGVVHYLVSPKPPAAEPSIQQMHRVSAYYPLRLTVHKGLVADADVRTGGALARNGDVTIGMTGLGVLYRLIPAGPSGQIQIQSTRLPIRSPLDETGFDADAPPEIPRDRFRAHDLIIRFVRAGWELLVTHQSWDRAGECYFLTMSRATLDSTLSRVVDDWREVFRTQPCLKLGGSDIRGEKFEGAQAGGRMAWLEGDRVFLTVGDYSLDGWNQPLAVSQDHAYDYGKTFIVDLSTGTARRYSSGHRNPQGLYVDGSGNIWSTEHGPKGGDELNLLVADTDYGWPSHTFGTQYDIFSWPLDNPVLAATSRRPIYAWVPSVGISNLVRVEGDSFERWKGDLLVGSLAGATLFRVALEANRPVYVEPLWIGREVRDVIEGADGRIWLWNNDGEVTTIEIEKEMDRGAVIFAGCSNCHNTETVGNARGPSLRGLLGRVVASDSSFNYSSALRRLGGRWTEDRLDAFLESPETFAPGTTMNYRVADDEDRRALLAYLKNAGGAIGGDPR